MSPVELIAATANPDKLAEMAEILAPQVVLLPRPADLDEVVEDAETLEGNARLKAQAVCRASGRPAVADDTGLEVDALDGAPGVHTARFAGPDATYGENVRLLLDELESCSVSDRTARFRTVVVVCHPDGSEVIAEGAVEGTIAPTPAGAGGFGYDPVFVPSEGDGRTFAQMDAAAKHRISHRGRALRALLAQLAT